MTDAPRGGLLHQCRVRVVKVRPERAAQEGHSVDFDCVILEEVHVRERGGPLAQRLAVVIELVGEILMIAGCEDDGELLRERADEPVDTVEVGVDVTGKHEGCRVPGDGQREACRRTVLELEVQVTRELDPGCLARALRSCRHRFLSAGPIQQGTGCGAHAARSARRGKSRCSAPGPRGGVIPGPGVRKIKNDAGSMQSV